MDLKVSNSFNKLVVFSGQMNSKFSVYHLAAPNNTCKSTYYHPDISILSSNENPHLFPIKEQGPHTKGLSCSEPYLRVLHQ